MNADGSVVIKAVMDIDEISRDLNEVTKEVKALGAEFAAAQKRAEAATKRVTAATEKLDKALEKQAAAQRDRDALLSAQEPIIQRLEDTKLALREAEALSEKYYQEWVANVPGSDRSQAEAQEKASRLRGEVEALYAEVEKMEPAIQKANSALITQEADVERLRKEFEAAAKESDRISNEAAELESKLDAAKDEAGGLAKQLAEAKVDTEQMKAARDRVDELAERMATVGPSAEDMEKATKRASKSMTRFANRFKSIVASALVFNILSAGLRTFTQWLGNAVKSNEKASAAIAKLKGALLTLAQPLLEVIIPAFTTFINILTALITKIAQFVAALFGTTLESASASAEALYNEQNAIEGVGDAAKKSAKSLAAFDEINKLSGQTTTASASGGVDTITPNFETMEITDGMQKILDIIEKIGVALLSWSLSQSLLDGINTLLSLGGKSIPMNIGLGISLLATGAALTAENILSILAGEYDAASLKALFSEAVSGLMLGAGFSLLTGVGAWAIPVAVALTIGITEIVVNWPKITSMWSNILSGIQALFKGNLEQADADFSQAFLDWMNMDSWTIKIAKAIIDSFAGEGTWDAVKEGLANHTLSLGQVFGKAYETISKYTSNIKGGFTSLVDYLKTNIVVGWGANWQNAVTLFKGAWDSIQERMGSFQISWNLITEELSKKWAETWDSIQKRVESFKTSLKTIVNGMLATVETFVNNVIKGINLLIGELNQFHISVPLDVPKIGGLSFGFNVPPLDTVTLPRLATGAVIPPNREFMAVLGDQRSGYNIEAPEALIRKIVREESGGYGPILQEMLDVMRAGKVMEVDGTKFATLSYNASTGEGRRRGISLVTV